MDEEHVEPQEEQEEIQEVAQEEHVLEEPEQNKQVPLSALQKERKKRQDLEQELYWERQRAQKAKEEPEDSSAQYESATKEDLVRSQNEAIRAVDERMWIRSNPDKYELINEHLPQFLKQRPNLASAINNAENRYEEAYTLMTALSPKQQQRSAPMTKRDAPHAPSSVPKGAAMNQAVNVMEMSDREFAQWRQSQKRR